MKREVVGTLLWIATLSGCGAGNEQMPPTTNESPAESCAQLESTMQQATAESNRGAWGAANELTVHAELLLDACTDDAARARYQQARHQYAEGLARWRIEQRDLVGRVQGDTNYAAVLRQLTELDESRAAFAEAEVRRHSASRRSNNAGAGRSASEDAQLRVREHAAHAQLVAVLRGFGLDPESARLLGLMR